MNMLVKNLDFEDSNSKDSKIMQNFLNFSLNEKSKKNCNSKNVEGNIVPNSNNSNNQLSMIRLGNLETFFQNRGHLPYSSKKISPIY